MPAFHRAPKESRPLRTLRQRVVIFPVRLRALFRFDEIELQGFFSHVYLLLTRFAGFSYIFIFLWKRRGPPVCSPCGPCARTSDPNDGSPGPINFGETNHRGEHIALIVPGPATRLLEQLPEHKCSLFGCAGTDKATRRASLVPEIESFDLVEAWARRHADPKHEATGKHFVDGFRSFASRRSRLTDRGH